MSGALDFDALDVPEEQAAEALRAEQEAAAAQEFTKAVHGHLWDKRARAEAERLWVAERAAESRRPLVLGSVAELSTLPKPEAERVQHLVPAEGSVLVVAQAGAGKTTLLMNLCLSLLSGTSFLDYCKVQKVTGTVALLSYEMSLHTLVGWAQKVGVDPDRLLVVDLRGVSNPLADAESRRELADYLRERGTEVVLVDTFTRAFTGDSENDTAQVARFLNDLASFTRQEVGASELILTAHAGWNGERARGSSGLYDWPDSIVRITKTQDGTRFLDTVKVRDGEGLEPHVLDYDPSTHRLVIGQVGTPKQVAVADKAAEWCPKVAQAVAAQGGAVAGFKNLKVACRALGWTGSDDVLREAARRAEASGLIAVQGAEGQAKTYLSATPSDPVDGPSVTTPNTYPVTPSTPVYKNGVAVTGWGDEVDALSTAHSPNGAVAADDPPCSLDDILGAS